ncbi:Retrotransposon nucleocapsid protein, related [Eimeria mitis]|uniref:Retrotransposon nucleocapsid protein, related n=1 Tax=Eimeria mitis TaxID=44415 RepID=U6K5G3_9EIME|nr:Retrotransposon nucleocapsid protein, related [Eimeria mitis]CDJ33009.1 Retrotransposon nucleocapsid protein, related [Eimeria mitis]
MRPSIEEYVLSCPDCQQQRPRNTLKPGFLHSLPIPDRIWTDISVDFIVGLPPVRGHDSIYVVVDRLSKYAHFIPCSSTVTAEGVAQLFINHVWKLHGLPKSIITDRDPKFVSAIWRSLMQQLGIDHNMTTANHQEADGQTERNNPTLVQSLRLYTQQNTSSWLDFLACAEWVYNTTVHSSTRCSPASLVYTETPLADPPLDLAVGSQLRPTVASDFGTQLAAARECMRKAQERQARNYDKRRSAVSFNPGDLVLVDSHALRSTQEGEQPKTLHDGLDRLRWREGAADQQYLAQWGWAPPLGLCWDFLGRLVGGDPAQRDAAVTTALVLDDLQSSIQTPESSPFLILLAQRSGVRPAYSGGAEAPSQQRGGRRIMTRRLRTGTGVENSSGSSSGSSSSNSSNPSRPA